MTDDSAELKAGTSREYPNDDHLELTEVAEFDQIISKRDVYRCTCGFAFISLSAPQYCPGCGGGEFRV